MPLWRTDYAQRNSSRKFGGAVRKVDTKCYASTTTRATKAALNCAQAFIEGDGKGMKELTG